MKYYVSIVIPAFNEEKRLPAALRNTIEFLKKQQYSAEIIVVSDGSKDGTKNTVDSFVHEFPSLWLIEYFPNRGKGFAVKTGMLAARGEYRLFMDADYAVPIDYLSDFLIAMDSDDKIIIGSRALKGSLIQTHQQYIREKLAKLFGVLQRFVLKLPVMDTQCGFKLFGAKTAEKLFNQITYDCAYFDAELLYIAHRSKIPIEEVPVKWKHDMETRLPVGFMRSLELVRKLFGIKKIHKFDS
jgi:glycosyltransferase involved in cell wall biosynthesis